MRRRQPPGSDSEWLAHSTPACVPALVVVQPRGAVEDHTGARLRQGGGLGGPVPSRRSGEYDLALSKAAGNFHAVGGADPNLHGHQSPKCSVLDLYPRFASRLVEGTLGNDQDVLSLADAYR